MRWRLVSKHRRAHAAAGGAGACGWRLLVLCYWGSMTSHVQGLTLRGCFLSFCQRPWGLSLFFCGFVAAKGMHVCICLQLICWRLSDGQGEPVHQLVLYRSVFSWYCCKPVTNLV